MANKHVALSDPDLITVGRRHGSEAVGLEVEETIERLKRDIAQLARWGYGQTTLVVLQTLATAHGNARAARPEAVASKKGALGSRDEVVTAGWRWVQQTEGALTVAALSDADLAAALNAAIPAETSQLEASIRALAKVLDQNKDRVDEGFDVPAQLAAAPGLADSIRKELAGAEVAKAAPVADTREIDLLDGKLVTWMARLNKTARRAFKDAGDDVKAKEYRFHHLKRGSGPRQPPVTPPTT